MKITKKSLRAFSTNVQSMRANLKTIEKEFNCKDFRQQLELLLLMPPTSLKNRGFRIIK